MCFHLFNVFLKLYMIGHLKLEIALAGEGMKLFSAYRGYVVNSLGKLNFGKNLTTPSHPIY